MGVGATMMVSNLPALRRFTILLAVVLLSFGQVPSGQAQIFGQGTPPDVRSSVDDNHVAVICGKSVPPIQSALSIGPNDHRGLSPLIGASGGTGYLVSAIASKSTRLQ